MTQRSITSRGPIGRKLVQMCRRDIGGKLVDYERFQDPAVHDAALQAAGISRADIESIDLSQLWWASTQQLFTEFVVNVGKLQATRPLMNAVMDAEDRFEPIGPPVGPLTRSYFFYWSICDLSPNGDGETVATVTLDVAKQFGVIPSLMQAMEEIARSRMGLWAHQGRDGDRVILREIVTGEEHRCAVSSSYRGHEGELWFARVLPPGTPELDAYVATTPYVVVRTTPEEWLAYVKRALGAFPAERRRSLYPLLMKYGEEPWYWPDYVSEAYLDSSDEVVYLAGLPDIAESRPRSKVRAGATSRVSRAHQRSMTFAGCPTARTCSS